MIKTSDIESTFSSKIYLVFSDYIFVVRKQRNQKLSSFFSDCKILKRYVDNMINVLLWKSETLNTVQQKYASIECKKPLKFQTK